MLARVRSAAVFGIEAADVCSRPAGASSGMPARSPSSLPKVT
jgi:hypothetical protein